MTLKFYGTLSELEYEIDLLQIDGDWKSIGGQHIYKPYAGGILNWWSGTGTIMFQGAEPAKSTFELFVKRYILDKPKYRNRTKADLEKVPSVKSKKINTLDSYVEDYLQPKEALKTSKLEIPSNIPDDTLSSDYVPWRE